MGCDLVYTNRTLVQLRTGRRSCCSIWYTRSSTDTSKSPISIRTSLGPNKWSSTYIFPPKGTLDLANNKYYSVEGDDSRYIFVDTSGDAWFFQSRIDFEAAIANYGRQGAAFHLMGAVHYSQLTLPKRVSAIASRYDRIMKNMIVEPTPVTEDKIETPDGTLKPYDDIQEILDFEFNRPPPPKIKDPLGIDFESIIKDALKD